MQAERLVLPVQWHFYNPTECDTDWQQTQAQILAATMVFTAGKRLHSNFPCHIHAMAEDKGLASQSK